MPTLGMLVYVGRISGRRYRTPLMIFSTRDGYVILIGYGVESNWPLACAFRRHERESLRRSRPCIVDAINTFRCKRRSNGAGQHYFGAMVSGSAPAGASIEIPLPEIGCKNLVHIHVYTAQEGTRGRRAVDHNLIKHRHGLALTMRPSTRLPCPPVPCMVERPITSFWIAHAHARECP